MGRNFWLQLGSYPKIQPGVRIPVEARFFTPVQTGPRAHSASYKMGTVFFPEVNCGRGVSLNPHSSSAVVKKQYSYTSTSLWAVRPAQSLSACTKVHCTLLFTLTQRETATVVAEWLRSCATNRKVTGSTPADITWFFIDIKSFRSHYGPGVDTACNKKWVPVVFTGGKVGWCIRLTTYHHPVSLL